MNVDFFQIQVNLLKKEGKNKFEMEQFHVTGSNGQILSTGGGQVLMQAMPDQVVLQSGQTIQTQGGQVILHMSIYIYNLSCITSLTWYYFLSTLNFYIVCYFLIFYDILYFLSLFCTLLCRENTWQETKICGWLLWIWRQALSQAVALTLHLCSDPS